MNAINDMRQVVEKAKSHEYASGCEFRRCMDAALDRIEREFMELPKDADDVPVKIGDKMWIDTSTGKESVSVVAVRDKDTPSFFYQTMSSNIRSHFAADSHHVNTDSWKKLRDDLARCTNDATANDLIRRCKALAGVE